MIRIIHSCIVQLSCFHSEPWFSGCSLECRMIANLEETPCHFAGDKICNAIYFVTRISIFYKHQKIDIYLHEMIKFPTIQVIRARCCCFLYFAVLTCGSIPPCTILLAMKINPKIQLLWSIVTIVATMKKLIHSD